jgi:hypothetical protein
LQERKPRWPDLRKFKNRATTNAKKVQRVRLCLSPCKDGWRHSVEAVVGPAKYTDAFVVVVVVVVCCCNANSSSTPPHSVNATVNLETERMMFAVTVEVSISICSVAKSTVAFIAFGGVVISWM